MTRRLIIDGQVFQTPAWHRGMGKYSAELIAVLEKLNGQNEHWDAIEIMLSSKITLAEDVIKTLEAKMENPRFTYVDLKRDEITNAQGVMRYNRKSINKYIDTILEEQPESQIDFLVLSPMQGGICSVFPSDGRVKKSVVFYDIIPFMFHEIYLRNGIAEIENLTKLTELLRANTYLAISKTAANDLAVYLGIDPSRICTIDGGPIAHDAKSKKMDIPKPFILMPTGNDYRKNNRLGIVGFSEFNKAHNDAYTLVITSTFDPDQIIELSKIDKNVVFTGNISGSELNYLFEECEALLFPSEYEGLGLPVLEAMEKNKPIACSDISVFREISRTSLHFFDQTKGTSIAGALSQAVQSKVETAVYKKVLAKYTWEKTGEATIKAIKNASLDEFSVRKKITVVGPSPLVDSPIARTMQRIHSELSRRYEARYLLDGSQIAPVAPRPNMFTYVKGTEVIAGRAQVSVDDSETVVYHIDNSAQNSKTLFTALAKPGIVILHSLDLSEAWGGLKDTLAIIPQERYDAEIAFDNEYGVPGTRLISSLIARQKAVVVFSDTAKKHVEGIAKKLSVQVRVVVANFPVSSLVYEEIIPKKTGVIAAINPANDGHGVSLFADVRVGDLKKTVISTDRATDRVAPSHRLELTKVSGDRQFEDALSRLSISFSDSKLGDVETLEAARYAVVPSYLKTKDRYLSGQLNKQNILDGANDFHTFISNYENEESKLSIHEELRALAVQNHSYRAFVKLLGDVIDEEESDE